MSSALIRQALEFVDPEEHTKGKKRGPKRQRSAGQGTPYKVKGKSSKSDEDKIERNIKKLLALSKPAANKNITQEILQRAIKGKPLLEKVEVKKEEEKSILFPEDNEPVEDIEEELFSI